MVAAGTSIVGELVLTDSLHLDGKIDGSIQSESEVSIGQSGQFDGELKAARVLVSGKIKGNVHAERLEIVSGGQVNGDVEVDELVIESGGQFNGSSRIRSQEPPRQLSYNQNKEPEAVPTTQEASSSSSGKGKTGTEG